MRRHRLECPLSRILTLASCAGELLSPAKVDTRISNIVHSTAWEVNYDRDKKDVYA